MTVADAFTLAINALMKERGWTQSDVMRRTGLSSPMVSRMASPKAASKRGASFPTLELLRTGFDVTAADLFIPRVVDVTGRIVDTVSKEKHTIVAPSQGDPVGSGLPMLEGGGMTHADPELLGALIALWDGMSADARLEMLAQGRRLKDASSGGHPVFRRR